MSLRIDYFPISCTEIANINKYCCFETDVNKKPAYLLREREKKLNFSVIFFQNQMLCCDTVDSQVIARNITEISRLSFPCFPHDNILRKYSISSRWHHWPQSRHRAFISTRVPPAAPAAAHTILPCSPRPLLPLATTHVSSVSPNFSCQKR